MKADAASTGRWFAPVLIGLAGVLAYAQSLRGPLVFDDVPSIANNPTLRSWTSVLAPPTGGFTVSGRPLLNLSLALNRWAGGGEVWGYHAVNLAIHVWAGLVLFGLVRRTLRVTHLADRFASVPLAAALLWVVHPLQTESVTYVVQRAESLIRLFYLLTLYCFVRSVDETFTRSAPWPILSVLSCLLGTATKEVMVTAPLVVLLYDRTFVAGSFSTAWRARWRYYLALALSWILLAGLVRAGGGRGGSAGFGQGIDSWHYLLTQAGAIAHYLRLAVWPYPLVIDYGSAVVGGLGAVWPQAGLVVGLLVMSGVALFWGRAGSASPPYLGIRAFGFLGAWFFLILAPTSSIMPVVEQTVAEHRMYLPLAALAVAAAVALATCFSRWVFLPILGLVATGAALTAARNRDYASELLLWRVTAAYRPDNPRAHLNLALSLAKAGRLPEALSQDEEALRLRPDYAEAHNNRGDLLRRLGRGPEARAEFERAVALDPGKAENHNNLGAALADAGNLPAAVAEYETALRLQPDNAEMENNLGMALCLLGRPAEGITHLERAVRLKPDFLAAQSNLASARRVNPDLAR